MSTVLAMPTPELETRALSVVDEARAIVIVDQESFDAAGRFLTERVKALLAEANETFDPVIASAHKTHQDAIAAKRKVTAPLVLSETIAKDAIRIYRQKQEEIQRAEERRLAAIEEDRLAKIREEEVELLEKQGADPGLIAAVCEEPLAAPAVRVAPTYQMPVGISTRETWSAKLQNFREMCRALATGCSCPLRVNPAVPEHYASPNMTALNQRARSDKGLMNIPGVQAVPDTGVSARRA